jgi:poly-gamma-glutamate capsule biosynthesis protein CapA/YwtB (metallophosphatase superfamily)
MSYPVRLLLSFLIFAAAAAPCQKDPASAQSVPAAQNAPTAQSANAQKQSVPAADAVGAKDAKPTEEVPTVPVPAPGAEQPAAEKVPTAVVTAPAVPPIVWTAVRPADPPTPEAELVVASVGDIMLGSTFPDTTGASLPPEDGAHLLDEVAPALKSADLAIGNLEGPLYDGTEPSAKCAHKAEGTCYAFRVPVRYAKLLADAGFAAMGVANNHAKDFGPAGQQSSIIALTAVGIAQSGAPGVVAHMTVKGKKVSYVAFATYPQFNNALDVDVATSLIQDETKLADYVIVSFHGGAEGADRQHVPVGHEMFLGEDRGDLRTFTHAMIDAGAALVFGHGPHVVRGMEIYKGHLIAYSLGNFATYGHINMKGVNGLSLVLAARLAKDGSFLGGTIYPVYQEYPGGPHTDPKGRVLDVVRLLSQADFGPSAVRVADDGRIVVPEVAPAVEKPAGAPVPEPSRQ